MTKLEKTERINKMLERLAAYMQEVSRGNHSLPYLIATLKHIRDSIEAEEVIIKREEQREG